MKKDIILEPFIISFTDENQIRITNTPAMNMAVSVFPDNPLHPFLRAVEEDPEAFREYFTAYFSAMFNLLSAPIAPTVLTAAINAISQACEDLVKPTEPTPDSEAEDINAVRASVSSDTTTD